MLHSARPHVAPHPQSSARAVFAFDAPLPVGPVPGAPPQDPNHPITARNPTFRRLASLLSDLSDSSFPTHPPVPVPSSAHQKFSALPALCCITSRTGGPSD